MPGDSRDARPRPGRQGCVAVWTSAISRKGSAWTAWRGSAQAGSDALNPDGRPGWGLEETGPHRVEPPQPGMAMAPRLNAIPEQAQSASDLGQASLPATLPLPKHPMPGPWGGLVIVNEGAQLQGLELARAHPALRAAGPTSRSRGEPVCCSWPPRRWTASACSSTWEPPIRATWSSRRRCAGACSPGVRRAPAPSSASPRTAASGRKPSPCPRTSTGTAPGRSKCAEGATAGAATGLTLQPRQPC